MIREATHAGTWYSADPDDLSKQIKHYLRRLKNPANAGARVVIAPHAGYTYSGPTMGRLFASWDCSNTKRVFILGPSHHAYFDSKVKLSLFTAYSTPIGDLPVDRSIVKLLCDDYPRTFGYMSKEMDENEHSFEMLAPFIALVAGDCVGTLPLIIPILISGMNDALARDVAEAIGKYVRDEENSFFISSDFCHWGSRFRYTQYWSDISGDYLSPISPADFLFLTRNSTLMHPVYKSIEALDKLAMHVASHADYEAWREYIKTTGNTICGEKAIGLLLLILQQQYGEVMPHFEWTGYSQSNRAMTIGDSSVSYASGYVVLPMCT